MRPRIYKMVAVVTLVVVTASSVSANAWCAMLSNCVTFSCAAMSLAGCVGGMIDGSLVW